MPPPATVTLPRKRSGCKEEEEQLHHRPAPNPQGRESERAGQPLEIMSVRGGHLTLCLCAILKTHCHPLRPKRLGQLPHSHLATSSEQHKQRVPVASSSLRDVRETWTTATKENEHEANEKSRDRESVHSHLSTNRNRRCIPRRRVAFELVCDDHRRARGHNNTGQALLRHEQNGSLASWCE